MWDIRNRKKLNSVFARYKPTLVFHASAYKHVPVLEIFPDEAISTNVLGSWNVIDACFENGSSKLVLISTDKAVNSASFMCATERVVELLSKCYSNDGKETHVVRFGNVLESNGSVVPLFRKQIMFEGPVTVTHPEVSRYFMTTLDAAQLVITASLQTDSDEFYILNMDKPIKILDIEKEVILLHTLDFGADFDIKIIGLRPEEK